MSKRKQYTDVRCIRLSRGLEAPYCWKSAAWLTLGHYNWACVENLTGALTTSDGKLNLNQFRHLSVEESKKRGVENGYCYNSYIFRESSLGKTVIDHFWDKNSAFMLITRVHSYLYRQTEFENALRGHFTKLKTSEEPLSSDVALLMYRTLDLSDVVVIMKSDSIEALLLELSKLYSEKLVGDIYSYCCINPKELTRTPAGLALKHDSIGLVSLRFSIRDAIRFDSFYNAMKRSLDFHDAFFVTGTEDITLIIRDVCSKNVCNVFRFIRHYPLNELELTINDMITRLGTGYDSIKPKDPEHRNAPYKELREKYRQLNSGIMLAIQNSSRDRDWHRALTEIAASLGKMSESAIFSQLSYILYGTMVGILHKIDRNRGDVYAEQELTDLLMDISMMIEHIIRMEGELVPHPETRPLLFDIPASILEYDLAFTEACAYYLKNREADCEQADKRSYSFFLVSRLSDNITIHDWINARQDLDRLLYVNIPYALIYKPFEVSCNLAHEVAHHSGEQTRLRLKRLYYITYCAAAIVCKCAGLYDRNSVQAITKQLSCYPTPLQEDKEHLYLESYKDELKQRMLSILNDRGTMEDIIYAYVTTTPDSSNTEDLYIKHYKQYLLARRSDLKDDFFGSFDQVVYLFSECYADIVMITLLRISIEEYIALFSEDYASLKDELAAGNCATYVSLIERTGLVINVISSDYADELSMLSERPQEGNMKDTLMFWREITRNTKPDRTTDAFPHPIENMCYHTILTLDTVFTYLSHCYEEIKLLEQNKQEELQHIRNLFQLYARECRLVSDNFYDELYFFRKKTLTDERHRL